MALVSKSLSSSSSHGAIVLAVYRACLRSAYRIPDSGQRNTYLQYTRDGFRRHQRATPESLQAQRALRDAQEQLESMNYYHSIREKKKNKSVSNPQNDNTKEDNSALIPKAEATTPSSSDALVRSWLREALPELNARDEQLYAEKLLENGFDSRSMLTQTLEEEDLSFMKKAHRRALWKYYSNQQS